MPDTPAVSAQPPQWAQHFIAVREEMDAWIAASARIQRQVPFLGVHDEGSFIASWLCHCRLTKDPAILDFARYMRDGFADWAAENLAHGFFPEGEVHHQTEIFNLFLLRLWHVDPDDRTAELILDAAEHIGNWVPGLPEWYDWDSDRFVGWHIGTVRMGEGDEFEVPDHFRLIQLALGAYLISRDERYLDLSVRWANRWAGTILSDVERLPGALFAEGSDNGVVAYARGDHHSGPGKTGSVEPYIAAGAVDVLLDLYVITGEPLYANAARALCSACLAELGDPDSNPPGALIQRYRVVTGDATLDAQVATTLEYILPERPGTPVMLLDAPTTTPVAGIGKRADMVRWGYRDGEGNLLPETSPSPSALALAFQINGKVDLATRALEMVADRLRLARTSLQDGRTHGCGGRSISAVASGHGRDSGYGNVTGCFYTLAHGATRYVGHERPALVPVEGPEGLPKEGASLTRNGPGTPLNARVWTAGELRTVAPGTV